MMVRVETQAEVDAAEKAAEDVLRAQPRTCNTTMPNTMRLWPAMTHQAIWLTVGTAEPARGRTNVRDGVKIRRNDPAGADQARSKAVSREIELN